MGFLTPIRFDGVIIYADGEGARYRTVFKRLCLKGESTFRRTDDPDDEYSD
jgi:hypothetical protein